MANKERNKRSARKARADQRAAREAAQAAAPTAAGSVERSKPAETSKAATKPAKARPGLVGRIRSYLSDVRTELHRVVWPSRDELSSYSLAVIATLVVFGVVVWLVDSGIVAALIGYTGLRG